ncbi:cytochrome c oxidase subunit 3 [Oceanicoccus sp. KOV_DT_Chl]|uniref:cytochrome c oxidase subunit 3 n=1 Tax=Oceanicoccus sp. KOV_DT_Chl TaxID=1904639 RepID=UPI00190F01BF|nr:cytochrome c oxidase subunit 3 [Oceanicoccus sp. KOV_DT_Chl]
MSAATLMKDQGFDGASGGGGQSWHDDPAEVEARRAKMGLRVLMAVISSLFFLFIIAFMIRSQLSDWEHLSAPWKPLANPWQLWVNTAMLVLASACLQWARVAARANKVRQAMEGLILAGIFSLVFVLGQLWVWQTLMGLGYYVATNPSNSFFYLFTGLHALHLLGGLVAWVKTTFRAWRGIDIKQLQLSTDLCAMYWHYLLGLWLVLLGLLTSSPETYEFLARLCGF